MKILSILAVIILVIGGILLGFIIGKNDSTQNTTSTSNTISSPDAVVLDLSNTGLTKVTSEIYSQTDTTELILSYNSIQTLPTEIGTMTNVVTFKIDHNLLDGSLLAEIRQMSNLRALDVSNNNMTGMPAEIGQLSKLETLNYSNNKITGLPNELGKLKNSLKEFNLTGNPLSQDTIDKLKSQLPNTTIIF